VSLHAARTPTRDEIVAAYTKPLPAGLIMACFALAAIGTVAFIAGAFMDADRAWRAFHVNWLYFTSLSSAGVMFVAVQRITTARWSRSIIRFMEGYVAFLPIAFVMLLLSIFLGKHHIFPWTHEVPPVHEKVTWYNATFLTARVIVAFGVITWLAERHRTSRLVLWLGAAGTLSLTLYVLHALIFDLVVNELGWIRPTGLDTALLFAGCFWLVGITAAVAWRRRFGSGPFEWLYRWLGG